MVVEGSVMIEREKPDRDWREYNEQLVQRGEILLAVDSLQGWQEELREMIKALQGSSQLDVVLRDIASGLPPPLSPVGGAGHEDWGSWSPSLLRITVPSPCGSPTSISIPTWTTGPERGKRW